MKLFIVILYCICLLYNGTKVNKFGEVGKTNYKYKNYNLLHHNAKWSYKLHNDSRKTFIVDELSEEDKYDPSVTKHKEYHDYNHDHNHYTVEEVKAKLIKDLSPEHVDYSFDG